MSKFNYFYKITNLIDKRYFYYGVHCTDNIEDGYMGSGSLLQQDYITFGVKNFKREILKFFNTPNDAFKYEKEMITESLLQDPFCYNIAEGGRQPYCSNLVCSLESDFDSSHTKSVEEPFIKVTKKLIQSLGPTAAILYCDLFSKATYFSNKHMLDGEGRFFNTFENISEDLNFSPHQIRTSLLKLKSVGLIDYKRKGHPPKYYFLFYKIDFK